jgi:hypothetical protein
MEKLYGLKVLKNADGKCVWSEAYLLSHSIDKLKAAAILPEGVLWWYTQRSDVDRRICERNTVTFTTNYNLEGVAKGSGPYYKIVEVPFII